MSKPSLIVVDDEPDMANFVRDVVEMAGFDGRMATSAREFQEICAQARPDAVVMDLVMPDMGGNELFQWLAEWDGDIPVILISGYEGKYIKTAENLGTARGARVVDSLAKPLELDHLEADLNNLRDDLAVND
ncbi:MAG: response regulator [Rhodospirillales bacterium]|nr:response regulator [Rhodospirillales bacterium]